MSYAVMYLFNSKESGVQTYIGNRVFSYPTRDVDFYLQQLVNMYIHMHDVAEVIHPYLVTYSIAKFWKMSQDEFSLMILEL
jgi:phosphatidylinositol 4-kinase